MHCSQLEADGFLMSCCIGVIHRPVLFQSFMWHIFRSSMGFGLLVLIVSHVLFVGMCDLWWLSMFYRSDRCVAHFYTMAQVDMLIFAISCIELSAIRHGV